MSVPLLDLYFVSFLVASAIYITLKINVTENSPLLERIVKYVPIKNILPFLKSLQLILALLFSYLLASDKSNISSGILAGLLFCLIGDYLIDRNLIEGMLSFGIAHLFLAISFLYGISIHLSNLTVNDFFVMLFVSILAFAYDLVFIRYLTTLKVPAKYFTPIVLYILVISFMYISATWLTYVMDVKGLIILPIGALLFMVSDSIIAIREFSNKEIKNSVIKVMGPYFIAVFFISLTSMFV